jgi:hypothetical protein
MSRGHPWLGAVVAVAMAACGSGGADSSLTGAGTAPSAARTSTSSAVPTTTSTTKAVVTTSSTVEVSTTTVPTGKTAVVASADGVLGWWDGTSWVQAQSAAPVAGGETYQVFRLGSRPRMAVGSAPGLGCDIAGGVAITLDPAFRMDDAGFDPFSPHEIAVTASWDATPHPVSDVEPGADLVAAVSQALKGYGIDDPAPSFAQLFAVDIDGDGVDETFGVAERRSDPSGSLIPAPAGDYSLAFAQADGNGSPQLAVLGEYVVVEQPDDTYIQDLVVFRFDAVLDADHDGIDEVALRASYYEGSGVGLWDWRGPDVGFVDVIDSGCGA